VSTNVAQQPALFTRNYFKWQWERGVPILGNKLKLEGDASLLLFPHLTTNATDGHWRLSFH
jgi:hypothetical protein